MDLRLAQVSDGTVVNVILAESGEIPDWCSDWPECMDAGPGWSYDGATFRPPTESEKSDETDTAL